MANTFLIDVPELALMRERWTALPALRVQLTRNTLLRSGILVQGVLREETPVRTGKLRDSFTLKVTNEKAVVSSKSKYGPFVNEGTGLYGQHNARIVPLHAKVLASRTNPGWGTKNAAGYYIIGKSTQGQRANPFMQRAYDRSVPLVRAEFAALIKTTVESLNK